MQKISTFPEFKPIKKNLIIHALKCVTVSPENSHPSRYWAKDKLRFIELFNRAKANNAQLVLVNYSDFSNLIKRILVKSINSKGIVTQKQDVSTREQFDKWKKEAEKTYNIL